MSTFKTALRMALAHPFYLLIYTVFISLMGVFIAASVSWNSSQLTEYKPYDTNVIVVDRDDSDLSRALTKHLGARFDLVTGIGDDAYDLADALSKSNSAKGSADCVFFIPDGFEDDLIAAARAGETLPKLDVTYGFGTMAVALSSAEASRWISLAGAAAALEPAASDGDVAKAAEHATAAKRAEVQIEQVKVDSTAAATLESYFNFGAYAIISSVIVSVGLVFSGMNEPAARAPHGGRSGLRAPAFACRVRGCRGAHRLHLVCVEHDGCRGLCRRGCRGRRGSRVSGTGGNVCPGVHAAGRWLYPFELGAREELLNGVGNLLGMLMTFLGWRLDATVAHGLGRADGSALCADILGERRDRQGARVGPDVCRAGRHRLRPGRHRTLRRRHRRRRPSPRPQQIPRLAT